MYFAMFPKDGILYIFVTNFTVCFRDLIRTHVFKENNQKGVVIVMPSESTGRM
jgi:hypothetical protein